MADVGIKITALDNTKAAFDSVGRGLGTIQTSAASVAGALASIGVGISIGGFVAMTKQIVDGLDAMNDLKDATGASIENISALEDVARRTGASFDTVSTSLIKLNQGLSSAKAGSDTEAAIKAIGLSVKDLKALDPAEAFRQIAVGLSGFADDGNKARIVQELFGKSLKEVAPLLKDVAEAGQLVATVTTQQAEEAEKFNKQIFAMQANIGNAARSMTSEFLPTLNAMTAEFLKADTAGGSFGKTLGESVATGLEYAVRVGAGAAFVFKTIGKEIGGVVAGLDALGSGGGVFSKEGRAGWSAVFDARAEEFAQDVKSYNDLVDRVSGAKGTPSESIGSVGIRPTVGDLPDQGAARAAAAASAKSLAEYNRELEKQAKLMAENAGLTGSFAEDWDRLAAIFKKGGYNLAQLTEAQAKLLAGQPGIKAYNDAEVKAAEAIEKARVAAADARQKYTAGLDADLGKLQDESTAMQEYVDQLGLSKVAVAELDAQRLESQAVTQDLIVLKKIEQGLDEDQYDIYVKMSAELRKQATLKVQGSVKEAQLDMEKEIAAERKRGWEETDRLGREVWTDLTTQGENAAKKIGNTLQKTVSSALYDVFAKPFLLQVYTSIAGGGGAVGSSASSASSVLNAASGGSGVLGTLGSAFSAFGGTFATGFMNTIAGTGAASGFGAAGAMIGNGSYAAGAGMGIGAAAPWVLGAMVLKNLTDYKIDAKGNGITATVGGASGLPSGSVGTYSEFQQTGGLGGGGVTTNRDWGVADQSVANYITGNVQAITSANKQYGAALGLTSDKINDFTKNIEVNITGLDAAGQKAAIDKELAQFSAEQISATYGDALAAVAKTGETTSDTLARLSTDITGVNSVFGALGYQLYDVSVAGAAAASGLASAFGSLAAMQSQTAALYNNYYTQAEQKAYTVNSAAATLSAAGITGFSTDDISNATREQVRAVVDQYAAKIGTTDGDKQYAAVVAAANSLNSYVPAFEAAAKVSAAPVETVGSSGGGGGGASPVQDAALSAWQDATSAIVDTMADLRTTLISDGPNSLAKLQAQFAIETAKAKAGDLSAAQDLPALAKSLADANKAQATSSVQQAIFTARIVDALGSVAGLGNLGSNISVPAFASGGLHSGGWAMVGENGPELVNMPAARVYNAQDTRALLGSGQSDPALLEELRAVRAELAAIRASSASTATASKTTAKHIDAAANGGQPLAMTAV